MKPRPTWMADEIKVYETHPIRGAEILSALKYIPADVIQIIMEHHENCQGLGFPARLRRTAIHPMAKLISIADEFCERIIQSPSSSGMSPIEAVAQMNAICSDRLDPEFFGALMRLCQFTAPPRKRSAAPGR